MMEELNRKGAEVAKERKANSNKRFQMILSKLCLRFP